MRNRRRPALLAELLVGLVLFAAYLVVDSLHSAARTARAYSNALLIEHIERWSHLDVEKPLNHWLAQHHTLMIAANYEYATTYLVSAALLLLISYRVAPHVYRQSRNTFVVMNVLAFASFAAFPLTPPRLMPGFIDTVARGNTVGSWGSPLVAGANQLAAMPSLHLAWALWVSVMLVRLSRARWLQILSVVHVLLTLYVVLATGNHYLLDAVGAVVVVTLAVPFAGGSSGNKLSTADAFFLDVERSGAAQNIGGMLLLDAADATSPSWEAIRDHLKSTLSVLPHFTDKVVHGRGGARWVPAGPIDWDEHLVEVQLPASAGIERFDAATADFTAHALPRDRPLWRVGLFRGLEDGRVGFVIVMHHCIADGIGGVIQLTGLLRPSYELPIPQRRGPGVIGRGFGVALGLAQLATDGRPAGRLAPGGSKRALSTAELDLDEVRSTAKACGLTVTELLLAAAGGAVAAVDPGFVAQSRGLLRVSVPVMLRVPDLDSNGNQTGAVLIDAPVRDADIADLSEDIRRLAAPLRSATRALAARWVLDPALRCVPLIARRQFARRIYGPRRFQAIVSNMPGPVRGFTMLGFPVQRVLPILPPAPGIVLTIGALSWDGKLGITVVTDADRLDASAVQSALCARLHEAAHAARGQSRDSGSPQASARNN